MIDYLISFLSWIDQCDDLPPQCLDETWLCSCQSFLTPFLIIAFTCVFIGIMTLIRMFTGKQEKNELTK
jgi:hypothetical protein